MEDICVNMVVMTKEEDMHLTYLFVGPSWLYCRNYIPKNKDHQTSRTITKTDNNELGSIFHIWEIKIHEFF